MRAKITIDRIARDREIRSRRASWWIGGVRKGTDKGLFISWPKLAPIILGFIRHSASSA